MLENWRYNRALEAHKKQWGQESRETFLEEEYRIQVTLAHLGVMNDISPSDVPKVGNILIYPELIPSLRMPYAVEVLGMPNSGKTTMINRYLIELWTRDERNKVALVEEGAGWIKQKYKDLRVTNPFAYSMLGGMTTFFGYVEALRNVNSGLRTVVSDRGQIDRRIFRRALFSRGDVNPKLMDYEEQFMRGLENTPIQLGGIIMLMVRPEESIKRGKPGPVTNMEFLPRLYEQYWRLHEEILHDEVPCRLYTCMDAEKDTEEVYVWFKNAMDACLNIHSAFLAALVRTFPEEYDRVRLEYSKQLREKGKAQKVIEQKLGESVLIVGGDD